jgi:hypothetical protein
MERIGEDGQWYRGGEVDKRVWAASGNETGRVGRLHRLMKTIDVDHNGSVESWEFVKALSRADDFDRPVKGGSSKSKGLGRGRLNMDGSFKDEFKPGFNKKKYIYIKDDGHGARNDDEAVPLLVYRLQIGVTRRWT